MLAKIKINSIETLMSQALIDLDISHEEFKTIVNEKETYEEMKESIRNIKSRDELSENRRDIRKNSGNAKIFFENIFLFCVYKMVEVIKETWEQNGVELIIFNDKKWLNEKHIEIQLGHANLPVITLQYSSELRKKRKELQSCCKNQPCRRSLEDNFAKQIIMDRRTTAAVNFRTRLGFSQHDLIMTQDQSVLSKIVTVFAAGELPIEVDEQGHNDRDIDYEIKRQKAIENKPGCEFIRIIPAKDNFNIFIEIGKIQNYITKSTKN